MRNINLIFCCDISIHWNATFVLINNPPKSFIYGLEFFNVCPTNYLVFSRDSWNHSSSSNFIRHKTCNRSADFGNHHTLQEVCPGLKNSSICAYNNIFQNSFTLTMLQKVETLLNFQRIQDLCIIEILQLSSFTLNCKKD